MKHETYPIYWKRTTRSRKPAFARWKWRGRMNYRSGDFWFVCPDNASTMWMDESYVRCTSTGRALGR
jgi:hypothetical protein